MIAGHAPCASSASNTLAERRFEPSGYFDDVLVRASGLILGNTEREHLERETIRVSALDDRGRVCRSGLLSRI